MIKSMTGYGKGQALSKQGTITLEIRSLNHKYFDLVCRLPNHLGFFEDKVRDLVKKRIRRGRINLSASWEGKEKNKTPFSLNLDLARHYYLQLIKLKKTLGLKKDFGLEQIMALPEIINYEQKSENPLRLYPVLKKSVEAALDNLENMRAAEGRRLQRDLLRRIKKVKYGLNNIEEQLPRVSRKFKKSVLKKVQTLSGIKKPSQERIAEEVALFVRNSDVSEEVTRIKSHLKAFKTALYKQKEAGKELDFIAQELFREANTIGAKANDYNISRWVIKIKGQIEKMREQLQNVE